MAKKEMDQQPVRLIQISDMHLFADPEHHLLQVNTEESFRAVVDLIQEEEKSIDLIMLTGDLSQDGSESSYRYIADKLEPLHVPVYFVPGNHDYPSVLAKVFPVAPISNHKHIVLKNWHLILLNSQKPGEVSGYLDRSQLDYLEHCLQTYPEHDAMIVFHHQPISVGGEWLDNVGLKNSNEFWTLVEAYPKVNTILFGHVHQEFFGQRNNVKCYAPPSTCIQFKRNQDHFGLENLPPGYRWIDLYPNGRLETGIKRVAKYIGVFDDKAKGY